MDRWIFQQCFTPEDKGQENKSLCTAKGITSLSSSQTELLNWARYLPFPDNKSFFLSSFLCFRARSSLLDLYLTLFLHFFFSVNHDWRLNFIFFKDLFKKKKKKPKNLKTGLMTKAAFIQREQSMQAALCICSAMAEHRSAQQLGKTRRRKKQTAKETNIQCKVLKVPWARASLTSSRLF